MINLIIENSGPQDFPEELTTLLENNFKENREIWYFFGEAFWPKNRKETHQRFMALPEGSNIICDHTFDGYQQVELMIDLLSEFKRIGKKVNVYIYNPCLDVNFKEFIEGRFSSIEPEEIENDYELRKEFKRDMNKKFFDILEYHEVYQMERSRSRLLLGDDLIKMTRDVIMAADIR